MNKAPKISKLKIDAKLMGETANTKSKAAQPSMNKDIKCQAKRSVRRMKSYLFAGSALKIALSTGASIARSPSTECATAMPIVMPDPTRRAAYGLYYGTSR